MHGSHGQPATQQEQACAFFNDVQQAAASRTDAAAASTADAAASSMANVTAASSTDAAAGSSADAAAGAVGDEPLWAGADDDLDCPEHINLDRTGQPSTCLAPDGDFVSDANNFSPFMLVFMRRQNVRDAIRWGHKRALQLDATFGSKMPSSDYSQLWQWTTMAMGCHLP
jgi:hypothetical protein